MNGAFFAYSGVILIHSFGFRLKRKSSFFSEPDPAKFAFAQIFCTIFA
jgi:hypothetical protein